jgi:hypothetical protein
MTSIDILHILHAAVLYLQEYSLLAAQLVLLPLYVSTETAAIFREPQVFEEMCNLI